MSLSGMIKGICQAFALGVRQIIAADQGRTRAGIAFSHPDFNSRPRNFTESARGWRREFAGYHRRYGITPVPKSNSQKKSCLERTEETQLRH